MEKEKKISWFFLVATNQERLPFSIAFVRSCLAMTHHGFMSQKFSGVDDDRNIFGSMIGRS
jgi:hypothetical protein